MSVGIAEMEVEGRTVFGEGFITSVETPILRIPQFRDSFTLISTFVAEGFVSVLETGSPEFSLRGAGTATMNFGLDPSVPDAFRVRTVDLQFGDAAPIPEPGTILLLSAATVMGVCAGDRVREPVT